ncbi:hypothetical protein N2597_08015 [Rhizobium sophoriradicis]|uniref:hypothetical protein n=1 Tax=Rhizobium sophoriradicis TaxID=1535245 RepID=UPI00161803F5|nr:hypothetical protein N2597_08015 [Rhizobium leguminosarum bv. phaseoli]
MAGAWWQNVPIKADAGAFLSFLKKLSIQALRVDFVRGQWLEPVRICAGIALVPVIMSMTSAMTFVPRSAFS